MFCFLSRRWSKPMREVIVHYFASHFSISSQSLLDREDYLPPAYDTLLYWKLSKTKRTHAFKNRQHLERTKIKNVRRRRRTILPSKLMNQFTIKSNYVLLYIDITTDWLVGRQKNGERNRTERGGGTITEGLFRRTSKITNCCHDI